MLKNVKKIGIQGASFTSYTQLPILMDGNNPLKAVLLYGRNGSGKSTIARAFNTIKDFATDNIQIAKPLDDQGNEITLSEDEKKHIYVFDEDYINSNVHIQEDGLGSIVMLGEQAGLEELIANATEELRIAEEKCSLKNVQLGEYLDHTNPNSPKYYIDKMHAVLRQDDGWAGRKRIIDGLRRNASVNDNTYMDFVALSPTKTRDELIVDYSQELSKLRAAQSGTSMIYTPVPSVLPYFLHYSVENGDTLLSQRIDHPELSEREQRLLSLVQSGQGGELRETAHEFSSPELVFCPKCHQVLSEEYKSGLIASIQKVLSEEVQNHQNSLRELFASTMSLDLNSFSSLSSYQLCVDQIAIVNSTIERNNSLLQAKIDDPYTPITEQLGTIGDALSVLSANLQQLERERVAYNGTVTNTIPIKGELTRINNEIAHWDIIEYARKYDKKLAEKEAVQRAYDTATALRDEKQTRLNSLNAQRDSIQIAIDVINAGLKYVFFSESRMQICIEGRTYKLLCNGHPVRPKDVSVGERNIIGLCYFFTDILERKSRDTAYSQEYLLVIDDPVSSYDFENRVGILSYLKYELGKFLLRNSDTRAIVMTHDLFTALDVIKMLDELKSDYTHRYNGQNAFSFSPKELHANEISRFEHNNRNEYTSLIKMVYDYAHGSTENKLIIGNVIRQVMEAFSTFEYKKGIDKVSTDDEILAGIDEEEFRVYFKNLMYRLVLNEGSHRRDQTRNMQIDYFSVISEPEKLRTAKEILCFIRLLNEPHIKAHLGTAALKTIDAWCEEIRNRAVTTDRR